MNKKNFSIAMAVELPIAFIVLNLLLNNRSDEIFYIAWAVFAALVVSVFVFLKKQKDEAKKEKLRKRIAKAFLAFILIGALIVAAVIAVFLFAFISEGF